MPRFLDRIIFIDSSGQEQTVAGGSVSGTPGTLALRDNTGRFLVGDTDTSSTDGYVVVNKNYVDGRISSLTKSDTAVSGKYVSKVSESSGEIEVTRTDFPTATSSQLGVVQRNSTYAASGSDYGFIKTGYTPASGSKNYAVQLSNGQAYVNVPWTDTTYGVMTNGGLSKNSSNNFSLNRSTSSTNSNYSVYFGNSDSGAVLFNSSKLIFNPSSGQLSATSFLATSDKKLKENIKEYSPEKSILDLPIYKFDFINGAKDQIGCLAQDLKEICPEIVVEDEKGYLSIQESKIVYLLLDEIKKLKEKVDKLERGE